MTSTAKQTETLSLVSLTTTTNAVSQEAQLVLDLTNPDVLISDKQIQKLSKYYCRGNGLSDFHSMIVTTLKGGYQGGPYFAAIDGSIVS